ncbi:hypothetical protein SDC9_197917 [bioreactor metagenome]|uniref:Uncharacterized protein n=1 Tax=bioreactor metagenome TaxID=1076179 RepID=A0A645IG53_9ZZZZ
MKPAKQTKRARSARHLFCIGDRVANARVRAARNHECPLRQRQHKRGVVPERVALPTAAAGGERFANRAIKLKGKDARNLAEAPNVLADPPRLCAQLERNPSGQFIERHRRTCVRALMALR